MNKKIQEMTDDELRREVYEHNVKLRRWQQRVFKIELIIVIVFLIWFIFFT